MHIEAYGRLVQIKKQITGQYPQNAASVCVTVDTGGAIKIEPSGLFNKLSHKAGKWIKKKL